MQIEEGKKYVTADDRVVGPLTRTTWMGMPGSLWQDSDGVEWQSDGKGWSIFGDRESFRDIVAEHVTTTEQPLEVLTNPEREQPRRLTISDIEDHGPSKPPEPADDYPGYAALADVLNDAYMQAARGKGRDRHSQGKPFLDQPILEIVRMQAGIDGHTYQVMKKAQEAGRMSSRGQHNAAVAELYGVIVYAAAAILRVREIETERGTFDTSSTAAV